MLTSQNLGRRFGSRWVFRGLDFSLEPGQCLCVVGANGSGKSTLLKVLAGLMEPSEGTVQRPVRQGLGYAALDLSLYPQLTAIEHVQLFARLRGVTDPGNSVLHHVGLLNVEGQYVKTFSTGMRARLKLALAVLHKPQVLLLDEPSAALDSEGRSLVATLIESQLSDGCAVIATNDASDRSLATHELELAG